MNFLVAWILFVILFMIGTRPISILPHNLDGFHSKSYLMPSMNFLQNEGFLTGEWQTAPMVISELMP